MVDKNYILNSSFHVTQLLKLCDSSEISCLRCWVELILSFRVCLKEKMNFMLIEKPPPHFTSTLIVTCCNGKINRINQDR